MGSQLGELHQRRHYPAADDLERGDNLQLLDILRQIARGHSLMYMLEAG